MLLGIVKVGDRRREMRLAGQQDVLGAAGEVGLVLVGQRRERGRCSSRGCWSSEKSVSQLTADGGDPDEMQSRGDERHVPEWGIVEGEGLVRDTTASVVSNPTGRYARLSRTRVEQRCVDCLPMPAFAKLMRPAWQRLRGCGLTSQPKLADLDQCVFDARNQYRSLSGSSSSIQKQYRDHSVDELLEPKIRRMNLAALGLQP